MEEKERYINQVFGLKGHYKEYVFDTYLSDKIEFNECYKVLNQQDKRIKELQETNKILSNELTKNSILKQDHIETCCGIPIFEIPKIKEENQQLKKQLAQKDKEQNQKAIEHLEKVKEIIEKNCFYNMSSDCRTFYKFEVDYQINQRINKLKGNVEDVKD